MNRVTWLIAGIALALGAASCKENRTEQPPEQTVEETQYGKTVEPEVTPPPVVDITDEKNAFIAETERLTTQLDTQIQQVESAMGQQVTEARQNLQEKRQELNAALESARQASADDWAQAKRNVDRAVDEVQQAYQEAAAAAQRAVGQEQGAGTTE